MRQHRSEIRVLRVLQKAEHWGKGIENENTEGGGFRVRILRVKVLTVTVLRVKILTGTVKATNGVWQVLNRRGREMV